VIPQDIPIEVVANVVAWVKRGTWCTTAITSSTYTVGDAIHLPPKRSHGAVVVVDDAGRLLGVVPRRTPGGTASPSCATMSTEPHTVPADADPRTGFDWLGGRRRLAPVVDGGVLVGVTLPARCVPLTPPRSTPGTSAWRLRSA
jgi:IMP dehydrogenase